MPVEYTGRFMGNLDLVAASIATEASITATSSATGDTCISTGAFTVENEGNYYVEVFVPYLTKGTTNLDVELWDGATFLTTLTGHLAASVVSATEYLLKVSLAAGGHNLTVKAFVDGGTGKFGANDGATGHAPNARIRVRPA